MLLPVLLVKLRLKQPLLVPHVSPLTLELVEGLKVAFDHTILLHTIFKDYHE